MNGQQDTDQTAGLEVQIRRTLLRRAESLEVTSADEERMKRSVHQRIEEESGMRKWSARKIAVVAAAACVLGSMTAVAAGKITHVSSHSYHTNDFTYEKLGETEERLGFATKAPEAFNNGYRFSVGVPVEQSGMDEEGNPVEMGEAVSLTYKKKGQPDLFGSVEKSGPYGISGQADQVFDHNGIAIEFSEYEYRMVPPDYQVSEAEQAMVDAGELVIAYGSRKVENKVYQSLSWEEGGVHYNMDVFDSDLTADQMAGMAVEIIEGHS